MGHGQDADGFPVALKSRLQGAAHLDLDVEDIGHDGRGIEGQIDDIRLLGAGQQNAALGCLVEQTVNGQPRPNRDIEGQDNGR